MWLLLRFYYCGRVLKRKMTLRELWPVTAVQVAATEYRRGNQCQQYFWQETSNVVELWEALHSPQHHCMNQTSYFPRVVEIFVLGFCKV